MGLLRRALSLLLLVALGLAVSAQVELPQKLVGERITLLYPPSLVSPEEAQAFLREQEAALSWVETHLGLPYEGQLQITIESDWFSWYSAATDRFGMRVIYVYESYPLRWLNTLKRTPVHELVHAVTIKNWGLSAPFLMEGIAMALDADYRGLQSSNLVSYGLLQQGKLPWLDIQQEGLCWLDYYPAGSFAHFILQRYGLEKFGELYRLVGSRYNELWNWARRTSPGAEEFTAQAAVYSQEIEADAEEIFGKGLKDLRAEWQGYLVAFSGMAERAEYALRALDGWEMVWELRVQLGGLAKIGLLGPVPQRLKELREGMITALRRLLTDAAPQRAQGELDKFNIALQAYRPLLASWQAAAQAFMDVQEMIYYGATSCGAILTGLGRAQALYSRVGDAMMESKVGDYIAAFRLLQQGQEEWGRLDCQAEKALWEAERLFQALGEERMVARVQGLLSEVRMICYLIR